MTSKKAIWGVIPLIAIILIIGCASVRVNVKFDREAPFSSYKTFKLVKPKPSRNRGNRKQINNPLFTKEVLREIAPILEAKGFTESASKKSADLLVIFYASIKNRSHWVPPTYYTGRWGRVYRVDPGHPVHFKEGTLVIDIVDNKTKELVWQGIGSDVLDRSNPGKTLINAVKEILKEFPPITE